MIAERILITGCSSGIGRATAVMASREGYDVIATARRPDSLADLAAQGITTAGLDVSDASQCEDIVRRHGPFYALINNAGFGQLGPFERISEEALRLQYDVNVFGLARLSQLVIPGMRERRRGRIIHIGSVVGKFTYPLGAAYCSSKHAVESLSDAMRLELAPFGIAVVLIEPGTIATRFFENAGRKARMPEDEPDDPYAFLNHGSSLVLGNWAPRRATPNDVAKVVLRAMAPGRPAARYVVTWEAKVLIFLRRLLPDVAVDFVVRRIFKIPKAVP